MSDLSISEKNLMSARSGLWVRLCEHPLFEEGFRVFFPAAALSAVLMVVFWGLTLSGVLVGPDGLDVVLLHQYDMIYGFLIAAMAGFLTTAVPAWSDSPKVGGAVLVGLFALWLLGRLAFWGMSIIPVSVAFVLHAALSLWLAARIFPHLWQARMRHLMWPVSLLMGAQLLTAYGAVSELGIEMGIAMAEGAFALMVLTALAPVSTVIVNLALEVRDDGVKFMARPPIRRAAMVCVSFYTAARMFELSEPLQGWLAFASMAAILNILQDWHLRKALSTPFSKPLYLVYWFFAFGFGLQAGSLLGLLDGEAGIAGQHMIFIGGFSLATLMVLIIAGLRHSGRELIMVPIMQVSIGMMVIACLARSLGPWLLPDIDWYLWAWLAFALSFACYLWRFLPFMLTKTYEEA